MASIPQIQFPSLALDAAAADEEHERRQATDDLKAALHERRLVIVTGVGVTLGATGSDPKDPLNRLSWKGMLEYAYRFLKSQPPPSDEKKAQERDLNLQNARHFLDQSPISSHLHAAQILRRELEESNQFASWLNNTFGHLTIKNTELFRSLKELHDRGATILTTNYDCLLDRYCGLTPVCGLGIDNAVRFSSPGRSKNEIFHLHGTYDQPRHVILDPIDYYRVRESEGVRRLLEMFLMWNTVLFVGCGDGLADENIGGLLRWISELQKDLPHHHTMLIKDTDTYNFRPLVRLKYGSNYSDLGPWLWHELLEHKYTTNFPGLTASGNNPAEQRSISTGALRDHDSGEGSKSSGSLHPENGGKAGSGSKHIHRSGSETALTEISGLHECDYCRRTIRGIRYKCKVCPDWDYCAGCIVRADILHNPEHEFQTIYDPGGQDDSPVPEPVSPSSRQHTEEEHFWTRNRSLQDWLAELFLHSVNNLEQVEPPITSPIPSCSECMITPESYPVFECQTCRGKPIICPTCRSSSYTMATTHLGHDMMRIAADLWFIERHTFFKDALPQVDAYSRLGWGFSLDTELVPALPLGRIIMYNMDVLKFGPRPHGNKRLALVSVPQGRWNVTIHISTMPSPMFGEFQLQSCPAWFELLLRGGLVNVGNLSIYGGLTDDVTNYLEHESGDPEQMFANNNVRHVVTYGTNRGIELRLPVPITVTEGQKVVFFVTYDRDLAWFPAQTQEIQDNVSFMWTLEGIHFVRYQSNLESMKELIDKIR